MSHRARAAVTVTVTVTVTVLAAAAAALLAPSSATGAAGPPPAPTPTSETAEWARLLDTDVQDYTQESLHPNTYGQRAMARCYTLPAAAERSATCLYTPGRGPDGMHLVPLELVAGGR